MTTLVTSTRPRPRPPAATSEGTGGDFHQAETKADTKASTKTETIGGDFHQAGTKAGDESEGISNNVGDYHQAKTKATGGDFEATDDDFHQAETKTRTKFYQDGNETDFYQADFHQAGTRAGDESKGIGDDFGEFHQAKTKATGSDFEAKGNDFHQAETRADTKARTKFHQDRIETDFYQAKTETRGKKPGRGRGSRWDEVIIITDQCRSIVRFIIAVSDVLISAPVQMMWTGSSLTSS